MTVLANCPVPWCKSEVAPAYQGHRSQLWFVRCSNCSCMTTGHYDKDDAERQWNQEEKPVVADEDVEPVAVEEAPAEDDAKE